jgi:CheY-like chemotaxis protein
MKNKLRCAIIDDEKHAITLLTRYIASMPNLQLVKTFTNPVEALSNITFADKLDILFLDVKMPHLNGLELASRLKAENKGNRIHKRLPAVHP